MNQIEIMEERREELLAAYGKKGVTASQRKALTDELAEIETALQKLGAPSMVKGTPTIRHDCGALLTTRRMNYRHGRLNIDPLYCPECHGKLTEFNIRPVNASAKRRLRYSEDLHISMPAKDAYHEVSVEF